MDNTMDLINKCMKAIKEYNPENEIPDVLLFDDDYSLVLDYMGDRYYLPNQIAAGDYDEIETIADTLGAVLGSLTDTLNFEDMLDSDDFKPNYYYVCMNEKGISIEAAEDPMEDF